MIYDLKTYTVCRYWAFIFLYNNTKTYVRVIFSKKIYGNLKIKVLFYSDNFSPFVHTFFISDFH